jgi:hypothetical protein
MDLLGNSPTYLQLVHKDLQGFALGCLASLACFPLLFSFIAFFVKLYSGVILV